MAGCSPLRCALASLLPASDTGATREKQRSAIQWERNGRQRAASWKNRERERADALIGGRAGRATNTHTHRERERILMSTASGVVQDPWLGVTWGAALHCWRHPRLLRHLNLLVPRYSLLPQTRRWCETALIVVFSVTRCLLLWWIILQVMLFVYSALLFHLEACWHLVGMFMFQGSSVENLNLIGDVV